MTQTVSKAPGRMLSSQDITVTIYYVHAIAAFTLTALEGCLTSHRCQLTATLIVEIIVVPTM